MSNIIIIISSEDVSSLQKLYQNSDVSYNNFEGRELLITALPTITFFNYTKLDNGEFQPEGGVDVEILAMLSKRFNFT